jgi:hypothetical protein
MLIDWKGCGKGMKCGGATERVCGIHWSFAARGGGVVKKFSWGWRAEKTGIWGRQPPCQVFHSICKWIKPVFWLGCYGCIFHGTGNSAQFWQNIRIGTPL